jgi:hypothetical protein
LNTSEFLTLLSVIVAAIAVILAYQQWLKSHQVDQSHLTVSCVFKAETYGGIGLIIVLKNTGRYPAFVENISLKLKSGKEIPFVGHRGFTISEPIKVTDEKPEELLFTLYTFMKEIKTPLNIKCHDPKNLGHFTSEVLQS